MTFEQVTQQIAEAGLLVNNLFQAKLPDGTLGWQANLRRGDTELFAFGRAPTPAVALLRALDEALSGPGRPPIVPAGLPQGLFKPPPSAKVISLAGLGLFKAPPS